MTKLCTYCKTHPISPRGKLFCSKACRGASQRATTEQKEAKRLHKNTHGKMYAQTKRKNPLFAEKERESRRLFMRKWSKEYPDIKKARNLSYKQNNRTAINAKQRIRSASYREIHRDEINQKALIYHKIHPEVGLHASARRRAHKANVLINDFNHKQWEEVKAAFHYCCVYCDKPSQRLEMDHLTPISKGGSHTLHNIVPACLSCNRKKHAGHVPCAVQPLLLTCAVSGFRKYTRK